MWFSLVSYGLTNRQAVSFLSRKSINFLNYNQLNQNYNNYLIIIIDRAPLSQDQPGQKQRLSKELGLTVGNVQLSDDLFNDEDLVQAPPANIKPEDLKRVSAIRYLLFICCLSVVYLLFICC